MSIRAVNRGLDSYSLSIERLNRQLDKIAAHEPQSLPPGMSILFINGMQNLWLDSKETTVDISTSLGQREVKNVHNNPLSIPETVEKLVRVINEEFENCSRHLTQQATRVGKVCIVLIAHSHGAVILEKALEHPSIQPMKQHFEIITIGGAALIPRYSYRGVHNLINEYDFVPIVAHSSFEYLKKLPTNDVFSFFIKIAVDLKNGFAETALQISSHKKPGLDEMILHRMVKEWCTDSSAAELDKSIEAFLENINKIAQETLPSGAPTPEDWGNFWGRFFATTIAHLTYNITILKRPAPTDVSVSGYFNHYHSVHSYLDKVSEITNRLIIDHEQSIGPQNQ